MVNAALHTMAFVWPRAVERAGPSEAAAGGSSSISEHRTRTYTHPTLLPLAVRVCIGTEPVYFGALHTPHHTIPNAPLLLAPGLGLRAGYVRPAYGLFFLTERRVRKSARIIFGLIVF